MERAIEKERRVNGPRILSREASGRAHRRMRRAIASRGPCPRRQGEPLKSPRRKAKAKAKLEERPKAKENASNALCAEGLDTPRGCAPAKDRLMTWSRIRPKEKTPTHKAVGPRRTTRHSNWDTLAAILFDDISTRTA